MSNPVLVRATGETLNPETGAISSPTFTGARMTMDDVIVKTGMLFVILLVGAFVGWSIPSLTFPALFVGLLVYFIVYSGNGQYETISKEPF